MSYPRIVHAVFNSPWAIQRAWLGTIFSLLHSRVFADGARVELPQVREGAAMGHVGRGFAVTRYGKSGDGVVDLSARARANAIIAANGDPGKFQEALHEQEANLPEGQIVHIFGSGIMGKHISAMEEMCAGGLSVDRIQAAIRAAADDPKCSAIMLHLDTPGGVTTGIPETAALVREVAKGKTVAAFCDSCTASAGYWTIGNAAAIYVTPSADLGSIGVYCALVDYTKWCEQKGIKVDLVTDGKYKGMGYPGTEITAEQRALIEADVMAISAMFKGEMRAARPGITDDTMQGQCLMGAAAVDAKLADTVVNDLDAALRDLATQV